MIDYCDICGKHNGSCNEYQRDDGGIITICPSCLFFGEDPLSRMARNLHKAGKLLKEVGSNANTRTAKTRAVGRR